MSEYKLSPAKKAEAEIIERKSRFIGYISPVSSEEEARAFIETIKEKHSDATHNVWAYVLRGGAIARCSDDGEPQGTAGLPTLEVLRKSGLDDCVVVVTRYFGGILLGAGGLTRAYSAAAKAAVDAAGIAEWVPFTLFSLEASYSDYQKLAYELPKMGATVESTEFEVDVTIKAAIESERYDEIADRIAALTNGKSIPKAIGTEQRPSLVK
ncbi:MAG: YigZ family protein [Eubacteriales bacterium]|jgi:uncharacterized YigZ family protein|nr:YigZ family protein [Clostridiales bacterium]